MLAAQKDPRLDAAPAVGEDPIHKQGLHRQQVTGCSRILIQTSPVTAHE